MPASGAGAAAASAADGAWAAADFGACAGRSRAQAVSAITAACTAARRWARFGVMRVGGMQQFRLSRGGRPARSLGPAPPIIPHPQAVYQRQDAQSDDGPVAYAGVGGQPLHGDYL